MQLVKHFSVWITAGLNTFSVFFSLCVFLWRFLSCFSSYEASARRTQSKRNHLNCTLSKHFSHTRIPRERITSLQGFNTILRHICYWSAERIYDRYAGSEIFYDFVLLRVGKRAQPVIESREGRKPNLIQFDNLIWLWCAVQLEEFFKQIWFSLQSKGSLCRHTVWIQVNAHENTHVVGSFSQCESWTGKHYSVI